jgi:NifB/MoaA-like Fe-S oxidoreductase
MGKTRIPVEEDDVSRRMPRTVEDLEVMGVSTLLRMMPVGFIAGQIQMYQPVKGLKVQKMAQKLRSFDL